MTICFSYLLEARELVEEHAEHHLVGLGGQVGQEEDLVGRGVVHAALALSARDSSTNRRSASLLKKKLIFTLKGS